MYKAENNHELQDRITNPNKEGRKINQDADDGVTYGRYPDKINNSTFDKTLDEELTKLLNGKVENKAQTQVDIIKNAIEKCKGK